MLNNFFLPKSCSLRDSVEIYGISRKASENNIIEHMCIACWITKAIDMFSVYVLLMTLPWQQLICKSTSMLRYMYMPYLV